MLCTWLYLPIELITACITFALLTAHEARTFVILEALKFSAKIMPFIGVRLFFLWLCFFYFLLNKTNYETVLILLSSRDICLVLISVYYSKQVFKTFKYNFSEVKKQFLSILNNEFFYILVSNSFDHILRLFTNGFLGANHLVKLEIVMRMPRLIQMLLFLFFRHNIFSVQYANRQSLYPKRINKIFAFLAALLLFFTYGDAVSDWIFIVFSSLMLAFAVPWYTKLLSNRKFPTLSGITILLLLLLLISLSVTKEISWSYCLFALSTLLLAIIVNPHKEQRAS